jgi:hypothetical protein
MPEIDIIHVERYSSDPLAYSACTPDGSEVWSGDENFNVESLVELATEYGITRWSEHTPDDGLGLSEYVVLVGWGEAPISRNDVQRSYHQGQNLEPMVNVKVHSFEIPKGEAFAELVSEHDLDPKLARLDLTDLRTLVEQYLEKHEWPFEAACESNFEYASDRAKEDFFPDHNVKVWSAGRSGGWLLVDGLPDVDSWGVGLLTKWNEFAKFCEPLVEDIPRSMAWNVLANAQDQLAGRIVRVELTLTLSDDDLDEMGNDPTEWHWDEMLNLSVDSEVEARKLP